MKQLYWYISYDFGLPAVVLEWHSEAVYSLVVASMNQLLPQICLPLFILGCLYLFAHIQICFALTVCIASQIQMFLHCDAHIQIRFAQIQVQIQIAFVDIRICSSWAHRVSSSM